MPNAVFSGAVYSNKNCSTCAPPARRRGLGRPGGGRVGRSVVQAAVHRGEGVREGLLGLRPLQLERRREQPVLDRERLRHEVQRLDLHPRSCMLLAGLAPAAGDGTTLNASTQHRQRTPQLTRTGAAYHDDLTHHVLTTMMKYV